jgi:hypothetical protein
MSPNAISPPRILCKKAIRASALRTGTAYDTTSFRYRRAVRPDEPGRDRHEGMGKVMAAIKERHAGKLDVSKASALVKKMLTGGG